jgi:diguanylate cyclase (GGDEF)-like protein
VLNEQKSVAWWDDALIYMSGPKMDREWIDANFGIFLTETYSQSEIYILDGADRPSYAYMNGEPADAPVAFQRRAASLKPLLHELRDGKPNPKLRQRADAFSAAQSNYRVLAGSDLARWKGHILSVDGRPAVVAAITIVPNVDMSLAKGTPYVLISISYIDEAFVGEIGRSLLLNDLALNAAPPKSGSLATQHFVADDGAAMGYLSWTARRPGQILLTVILPLVILGVVGAGLLAAKMFGSLKRASTSLADREALARFESQHDALSGLPNRTHFAEVLTRELETRAPKSAGGGDIVVAYIDVDRFKDINDTLGHHAGDALIRAVAHRLRSVLGATDFLSRFGGDEFAVMRCPAGPSDAQDLARLLSSAFDETFLVVGQNINVTASIGIAVAPEHGETTDQLMRHADIALYEGKAKGRDRAMFFTEEMAFELEDRRAIEVDLRDAIDQDMLTLHYQPITSAATNKTIGVEALLRWKHLTKGDISPSVFVPIAENAGLMPRLGAWTIDHALAQAARWPDLQMSINLSPVQFRHVDLEEELPRALARHKVDSHRIILEVTEGVLLEATDKTRQILESLRRMGFQIALDDFGTGYSSLAYLANFGFDKLKIDRSFVSGISHQKKAKTIVQAVVTIGRGLGMKIVAEGVETEAEAAMMRLFGCHEMQGYFFSRPVEAKGIDALLIAEAQPGYNPARKASA